MRVGSMTIRSGLGKPYDPSAYTIALKLRMYSYGHEITEHAGLSRVKHTNFAYKY